MTQRTVSRKGVITPFFFVELAVIKRDSCACTLLHHGAIIAAPIPCPKREGKKREEVCVFCMGCGHQSYQRVLFNSLVLRQVGARAGTSRGRVCPPPRPVWLKKSEVYMPTAPCLTFPFAILRTGIFFFDLQVGVQGSLSLLVYTPLLYMHRACERAWKVSGKVFVCRSDLRRLPGQVFWTWPSPDNVAYM